MSRTVVFISCGKTKQKGRHKARDLYQGDLFRKSLRYALTLSSEVYILSAKYEVLHLDQEIEDYEKTLNKMNKTDRTRWAYSVREWMRKNIQGANIVYLCGERYREGLPDGSCPMKAMSFGRQLQWLNNRLEEV